MDEYISDTGQVTINTLGELKDIINRIPDSLNGISVRLYNDEMDSLRRANIFIYDPLNPASPDYEQDHDTWDDEYRKIFPCLILS